jgi:hypothetical protein
MQKKRIHAGQARERIRVIRAGSGLSKTSRPYHLLMNESLLIALFNQDKFRLQKCHLIQEKYLKNGKKTWATRGSGR